MFNIKNYFLRTRIFQFSSIRRDCLFFFNSVYIVNFIKFYTLLFLFRWFEFLMLICLLSLKQTYVWSGSLCICYTSTCCRSSDTCCASNSAPGNSSTKLHQSSKSPKPICSVSNELDRYLIKISTSAFIIISQVLYKFRLFNKVPVYKEIRHFIKRLQTVISYPRLTS